MTILIHPDSHLDHDLTDEQLAWLLREAAAHLARLDEPPQVLTLTRQLPRALGTVPCGLYGPAMGDGPITDGPDVTSASRGGGRAGVSRLIDGQLFPPRRTRQASIIAGPYKGHRWVLFTAFGGPVAPREPHELEEGSPEHAESVAFWAEHALSSKGTLSD